MADLTTTYMGLTLKSPIVPSASPLSKSIAGIAQMADAGAAAITMYSLFEEQITLEAISLHNRLEQGSWNYAEALTYYPKASDYNRGPEDYLDLIREAKKAVDVPVIGSLNGMTTGGWIEYAKKIEQAGADALELNVYLIPTMMDETGGQVEQLYLDVLQAVKKSVRIPVAMKLSPFFSSMPEHGEAAGRGGRGRAGAVQPVLPARLRPGRADRHTEPGAQPLVRDAAAAALDCDPVRPPQGEHGAHDRRTHDRGRGEGHHGGRGRGKRRVGAAGAGRGEDQRPDPGPAPVDGRARVRVGRSR